VEDAPRNDLRVTYYVIIELENRERPTCMAELIAVPLPMNAAERLGGASKKPRGTQNLWGVHEETRNYGPRYFGSRAAYRRYLRSCREEPQGFP
jgi:hypothetical protein